VSRPLRAIDLLELAPVRRVPWIEREDGRVVIDRPRPPVDGLRGLLQCMSWMLAPRRIRLHQQVARALEEIYANRLPEHAPELAEHFSHSSDSSDLEKAVSYGEMAAERAIDVYAYGEAVRLLEQALKVQEILDPQDKSRQCDLLLSLCEALFPIMETRRIIEIEAPAAFSLAESLGDNSRAVGACIVANKIKGIRACLCHDTYSAHQGVEHDDMNIICLGARVIGGELAFELATAFLEAKFSGEERHSRRLAKVLAIERQDQ